MVGAILTGAKIAGSLLGNLLARRSQQQPAQQVPQQAVVNGPIEANGITLGPEAIKQAPSKPSFMDVIGNGLKLAQPLMGAIGAPAIGQFGGLARNILSTLNDDEWFQHYDGNGATFNELLDARSVTVDDSGSDHFKYRDVRVHGAMAIYAVGSRSNGVYYNNFMPQMLAYIRKKTNNVLTDDIDKYQQCFCALTKLYEIYYTLQKYYTLMLNVPSNCPTIMSAFVAFQPANVNSTKGIIDSLESFLKSTVKLPYAYVSYIRWRFGTLFLSSNTKKAGFISYDPEMCWPTAIDAQTKAVTWSSAQNSIGPGSTAPASPAQIATTVDSLKTVIIQCGRACADIALAYSNHVIKYDVEDRHFDEKEYCLRQNIKGDTGYGVTKLLPTIAGINHDPVSPFDVQTSILMDSRLDMNAGIQAITISTDNDIATPSENVAPFPVSGCTILMESSSLEANWPSITGVLTQSGANGIWKSISNSTFIYARNYNALLRGNYAPMFNAEYVTQSNGEWTVFVNYNILAACAISLELHNYNSVATYIAPVKSVPATAPAYRGIYLMMGTLSFDRATLSADNLKSIQRNAILNLLRGDYANKVQIDVKEEATEMVQDLTSKDVQISDTPISVK